MEEKLIFWAGIGVDILVWQLGEGRRDNWHKRTTISISQISIISTGSYLGVDVWFLPILVNTR